jgi:GTP-binding protein YchF
LREEGEINPASDKEIIDIELQFKDLDSVDKKIQKTQKQARVGGDTQAKIELDVLERVKAWLEQGKNVRMMGLTKEEMVAIDDLFLLTVKPTMYVANVDEASMHTGNKYSDALKKVADEEGAELVVLNNSIEAQIAEMEDPDDKALFFEEYKMAEPGLNRLIRSAYKLLNLATYFTAGVQEVRAWTIGKGWKAPQAASVIHTDFEKGFIKAEVIAFDDRIKYGTEAACREAGRLRIEGKEYIVQDGDVMHFRFNV